MKNKNLSILNSSLRGAKGLGVNRLLSISMRPRPHKQRKFDNHVYSLLLFVSFGPGYQVEC